MIDLQNISFRYKRNKPLFQNLNLQLNSGSIYGLLGKNGAGKSTMLKHLSGLISPQQGQATLQGQPLSERSPELLQKLYVVPEEFELPGISMKAYIKTNAVFYPKFSQEQLNRYLYEFELNSSEKLSGLSYGQKKKFLIAFGLATNARLLILDEPTNGLDIPSKSQFRKIMASALDEEKCIIISTHQVRDLENLIDVVLILEKGQIVFNHAITEISENLRFEHDIRNLAPNMCLYSEEGAGRKACILPNTSNTPSRVDLELLFNSVVKDAKTIALQLSKQIEYVR